ncbi:Hsp70 family protein [Kibdelosporangium phytohabitans]|uniref:ExoP galactose-binding-like domain-containing protein n=1 Tax=Kibdelosporangium phytohabitans TaxID=860235 RepID=A0A0N9I1W7_9PSEU|nr:Hsp70 family protein [Kibdelosporangium phytohabitans]ALG08438.1 hypothetical protein AOZ06_17310 [Kibdelosporangium phytohabitans]MBE1470510.1 actin-like ATPase involved in cell morphogenesis [Kibdelosporangium phytohabitans]
MWYGAGIDLGTSFTAAAVSGAGRTQMVPLSKEMIVPSVAYPAPDGALLTGTAALAAVDDPERVARNFKRRLGDPTPLVLGGSAYSAAVLMAAQLRDVLAGMSRFAGGPPGSVVLTCPAIWGPYRREHFTEVLRLAGVSEYRLITEPEAAATHYSSERRLGDGEVVAVYDLGGGTFDTTILRMSGGETEILGTPEGIEHMGGIDFDETLIAHVDNELGGAITDLDPADPATAAILVEVRAACVRAKEDLSIEPDVTITVPLPSISRQVTVTRLEFNDMIRPSVQLTTDALRRTIASAGLRAEDLSAVLLAGGSSRIPLVSQMVSGEFGKPVRVTLHPKFTVALGAAAVATRPKPVTVPVPSAPWPLTPPRGTPSPVPTVTTSRRKWLLPAVAATAIIALAVVTTLLITSKGGDEVQPMNARAPLVADTTTTSASTPATTSVPPTTTITTVTAKPPAGGSPGTKPAPPNTEQVRTNDGPASLRLYDNGAIQPFTGFIGDAANWGGVEIHSSGAKQTSIQAAPAGSGLRVTWKGDAPAQIYLQSPRSPKDLSSFAGGALVFDTTVQRAPTAATSLQVHCGYPCGSQVAVTNLFANLPAGKASTVRIPLSCFTGSGLDPKKVDTPFLLYTGGQFDATFTNIRWEKNSQGATPCVQLK